MHLGGRGTVGNAYGRIQRATKRAGQALAVHLSGLSDEQFDRYLREVFHNRDQSEFEAELVSIGTSPDRLRHYLNIVYGDREINQEMEVGSS